MKLFRRSVPAFAFGTILFVFFVYPVANVRAKIENDETFFSIDAQNDDSNGETNYSQNDDSSDSFDDSKNNGATNLWSRLDRDARGVPTRLSTSIVRYEGNFRGDDGSERDVSIDLIGAIHVAELEYYRTLNKTFQEYETVVFEMIAGRGVDVRAAIEEERKKKRVVSASPLAALSLLQQGLGDSLGLVYQIDGIDYSASNLRRGDAFAEDFLLEILSNGDVPNFFLGAFVQAIFDRSAGKTQGWALACAVAKNKRTTARRFVALELIDEQLASFQIESNANETKNVDERERENALIHYRDKIAIGVVRDELAAGRTRLAVFFGAAHMPDLARRLETELGLKRVGEPRWVPAWKMEADAR